MSSIAGTNSRVSSANTPNSSICSITTRAVYAEIYRTMGFLDGLSELPRPQATIEDSQFLTYYSLKAQKLTLTDILSHCSLTCVDPLEEFPAKPSSQSSVLFHKVNLEEDTIPTSAVPNDPKLHLNNKLLSAKQQQLRSLVHLYESEIQWLSLGSRLWFGPIRGRRVALLIDFSDTVCFGDWYSHYLLALHLLVTEQLSAMDRVDIYALGTETSEPLVTEMSKKRCTTYASTQINSMKEWLSAVRAQGSCDILTGLKRLLKPFHNIDTIAVILGSRPNQNLSIVHDYLVQLLTGQNEARPHFHLVAINTEEDTQVSLSRLAEEFKGHYHQLTFNEEKPWMEDTMINEINSELESAHEIFRQIENIKKNIFDDFLLETLRQLSVVSEWPTDDTFTPPTSPLHQSAHTLPLTSDQWLSKNGLKVHGLDLYHFLASDAYNQLSEYVSLIDKSAWSSVYDVVMPQFMWNDGTYKYLHVDYRRLTKYTEYMRAHIVLLKKRMAWLISGSRVPFGNISEKRAIILIDTSVSCGLYLTQLQQHTKLLLHEQVSKLEAFNLASVGESFDQWNSHLVPPTKASMTEAWKWILHINPKGTCNLLEALRLVLENSAYDDAESDLGLYIVISSMPDQLEIALSAYLEQKLAGRRLNLHLIFYQPKIPDRWAEVTLTKGAGRYGDTQGIVQCLKLVAENLGTYHQFTAGEFNESNDYRLLEREYTTASSYLETAENILKDYRDHYCKRNVRVMEQNTIETERRPSSAPPIYPRPTLASNARLNSTAMKLKEKEVSSFSHLKRRKRKGPFLTCHCFYLGRGLKKGLYYELMEFDVCSQCQRPLIPLTEEAVPTVEWLSKYSLKQLHLYSKGLFTNRKDGYKHVTTDGHIVELTVSHQQLNKLLKLTRLVRTRYLNRLQWLLKDSRNIFGCVTGKKVILLIDVSSSMQEHCAALKQQIVQLIKEQLATRRISSFNVVAFATDVLPWQPSLIHNTARNRSEAEEWVQKLTFGGCSNLFEAVKLSLRLRAQSIYLISDGDTDHTSSFLISQVTELQKRFSSFPWSISTIAYQSAKQESLKLLQTLARLTKGRYSFHPLKYSNTSMLLANSKTLYEEMQLGDDIKLLVDEILLADYAIKQTLYHLGR